MPTPFCSICEHKDRADIDREILGRTTLRLIASEYGVSEDALSRHKRNGHLPAGETAVRDAAEKAAEAKGMSRVDVAMDQLAANIEARQIAKLQKRDRDEREWAKEVRFANQHLAELEGELQTGTTVNVGVMVNQQADMQTAIDIVAALAPFPEAKACVLGVLNRRLGLTVDGQADAGDQGMIAGPG